MLQKSILDFIPIYETYKDRKKKQYEQAIVEKVDKNESYHLTMC